MTLLLIGTALLWAISFGRTVNSLRSNRDSERRAELWTSLSFAAGLGILISALLGGILGVPAIFHWAALALAFPFIGVGALRARRQLSARRVHLLQRTFSATTPFERLDSLEARRSLVGSRIVRRQIPVIGMSIFLLGLMGVAGFRNPGMAGNPIFIVSLIAVLLMVVLWILKLHRVVTERGYLDAEIESVSRALGGDGNRRLSDEAS